MTKKKRTVNKRYNKSSKRKRTNKKRPYKKKSVSKKKKRTNKKRINQKRQYSKKNIKIGGDGEFEKDRFFLEFDLTGDATEEDVKGYIQPLVETGEGKLNDIIDGYNDYIKINVDNPRRPKIEVNKILWKPQGVDYDTIIKRVEEAFHYHYNNNNTKIGDVNWRNFGFDETWFRERERQIEQVSDLEALDDEAPAVDPLQDNVLVPAAAVAEEEEAEPPFDTSVKNGWFEVDKDGIVDIKNQFFKNEDIADKSKDVYFEIGDNVQFKATDREGEKWKEGRVEAIDPTLFISSQKEDGSYTQPLDWGFARKIDKLERIKVKPPDEIPPEEVPIRSFRDKFSDATYRASKFFSSDPKKKDSRLLDTLGSFLSKTALQPELLVGPRKQPTTDDLIKEGYGKLKEDYLKYIKNNFYKNKDNYRQIIGKYDDFIDKYYETLLEYENKIMERDKK